MRGPALLVTITKYHHIGVRASIYGFGEDTNIPFITGCLKYFRAPKPIWNNKTLKWSVIKLRYNSSLSLNSTIHFSFKITKEIGIIFWIYAMICKYHCSQILYITQLRYFEDWFLRVAGWSQIVLLTLSFDVCVPFLKAGATIRVTGIGLFLNLICAFHLS